jgi:hypothetical protein
MVLRLLSIGLCAAGVVLIATLQPVRLEVIAPAAVIRDRMPPLSIVDVANRVDPAGLVELVSLRPEEWISAINDHPLTGELMVSEVIASLGPRVGEYVDLTVSSRKTERRVLVLMH